MTTYFLNKYEHELNRIGNMLRRYPDVGPNHDPDKMDLGHIMLIDERKKLINRVESEAKYVGIDIPLSTQESNANLPLRRPNPYASFTNNNNYLQRRPLISGRLFCV